MRESVGRGGGGQTGGHCLVGGIALWGSIALCCESQWSLLPLCRDLCTGIFCPALMSLHPDTFASYTATQYNTMH